MKKKYSLACTNKFRYSIVSLALLFSILNFKSVKAQCISIFPHTENFETAATWTTYVGPSSGSVSDWAWGTPNKSIITLNTEIGEITKKGPMQVVSGAMEKEKVHYP
jgi:hypothetical protein